MVVPKSMLTEFGIHLRLESSVRALMSKAQEYIHSFILNNGSDFERLVRFYDPVATIPAFRA